MAERRHCHFNDGVEEQVPGHISLATGPVDPGDQLTRPIEIYANQLTLLELGGRVGTVKLSKEVFGLGRIGRQLLEHRQRIGQQRTQE